MRLRLHIWSMLALWLQSAIVHEVASMPRRELLSIDIQSSTAFEWKIHVGSGKMCDRTAEAEKQGFVRHNKVRVFGGIITYTFEKCKTECKDYAYINYWNSELSCDCTNICVVVDAPRSNIIYKKQHKKASVFALDRNNACNSAPKQITPAKSVLGDTFHACATSCIERDQCSGFSIRVPQKQTYLYRQSFNVATFAVSFLHQGITVEDTTSPAFFRTASPTECVLSSANRNDVTYTSQHCGQSRWYSTPSFKNMPSRRITRVTFAECKRLCASSNVCRQNGFAFSFHLRECHLRYDATLRGYTLSSKTGKQNGYWMVCSSHNEQIDTLEKGKGAIPCADHCAKGGYLYMIHYAQPLYNPRCQCSNVCDPVPGNKRYGTSQLNYVNGKYYPEINIYKRNTILDVKNWKYYELHSVQSKSPCVSGCVRGGAVLQGYILSAKSGSMLVCATPSETKDAVYENAKDCAQFCAGKGYMYATWWQKTDPSYNSRCQCSNACDAVPCTSVYDATLLCSAFTKITIYERGELSTFEMRIDTGKTQLNEENPCRVYEDCSVKSYAHSSRPPFSATHMTMSYRVTRPNVVADAGDFASRSNKQYVRFSSKPYLNNMECQGAAVNEPTVLECLQRCMQLSNRLACKRYGFSFSPSLQANMCILCRSDAPQTPISGFIYYKPHARLMGAHTFNSKDVLQEKITVKVCRAGEYYDINAEKCKGCELEHWTPSTMHYCTAPSQHTQWEIEPSWNGASSPHINRTVHVTSTTPASCRDTCLTYADKNGAICMGYDFRETATYCASSHWCKSIIQTFPHVDPSDVTASFKMIPIRNGMYCDGTSSNFRRVSAGSLSACKSLCKDHTYMTHWASSSTGNCDCSDTCILLDIQKTSPNPTRRPVIHYKLTPSAFKKWTDECVNPPACTSKQCTLILNQNSRRVGVQVFNYEVHHVFDVDCDLHRCSQTGGGKTGGVAPPLWCCTNSSCMTNLHGKDTGYSQFESYIFLPSDYGGLQSASINTTLVSLQSSICFIKDDSKIRHVDKYCVYGQQGTLSLSIQPESGPCKKPGITTYRAKIKIQRPATSDVSFKGKMYLVLPPLQLASGMSLATKMDPSGDQSLARVAGFQLDDASLPTQQYSIPTSAMPTYDNALFSRLPETNKDTLNWGLSVLASQQHLAYWSRSKAQPTAKMQYEVMLAHKQCRAAEYRINSQEECLAAVRELQSQADPYALELNEWPSHVLNEKEAHSKTYPGRQASCGCSILRPKNQMGTVTSNNYVIFRDPAKDTCDSSFPAEPFDAVCLSYVPSTTTTAYRRLPPGEACATGTEITGSASVCSSAVALLAASGDALAKQTKDAYVATDTLKAPKGCSISAQFRRAYCTGSDCLDVSVQRNSFSMICKAKSQHPHCEGLATPKPADGDANWGDMRDALPVRCTRDGQRAARLPSTREGTYKPVTSAEISGAFAYTQNNRYLLRQGMVAMKLTDTQYEHVPLMRYLNPMAKSGPKEIVTIKRIPGTNNRALSLYPQSNSPNADFKVVTSNEVIIQMYTVSIASPSVSGCQHKSLACHVVAIRWSASHPIPTSFSRSQSYKAEQVSGLDFTSAPGTFRIQFANIDPHTRYALYLRTRRSPSYKVDVKAATSGVCFHPAPQLACAPKIFCGGAKNYYSPFQDYASRTSPGRCLRRTQCENDATPLIMSLYSDTICLYPSNIIPLCNNIITFAKDCKTSGGVAYANDVPPVSSTCRCVATSPTGAGQICRPGSFYFPTFSQNRNGKGIHLNVESGKALGDRCQQCPAGTYSSYGTVPKLLRACETDTDCCHEFETSSTSSAKVCKTQQGARCHKITSFKGLPVENGCAGSGPGDVANQQEQMKAQLCRRNNWKKTANQMFANLDKLLPIGGIQNVDQCKSYCLDHRECRAVGFTYVSKRFVNIEPGCYTPRRTIDFVQGFQVITQTGLLGHCATYALLDDDDKNCVPNKVCDTRSPQLGRVFNASDKAACKKECENTQDCMFFGYSWQETAGADGYKCRLSSLALSANVKLCIPVTETDKVTPWPCYRCPHGKYAASSGTAECQPWTPVTKPCDGHWLNGTTTTDRKCIRTKYFEEIRDYYTPTCTNPNQYKKLVAANRRDFEIMLAYEGKWYNDPAKQLKSTTATSLKGCIDLCRSPCGGITYNNVTNECVTFPRRNFNVTDGTAAFKDPVMRGYTLSSKTGTRNGYWIICRDGYKEQIDTLETGKGAIPCADYCAKRGYLYMIHYARQKYNPRCQCSNVCDAVPGNEVYTPSQLNYVNGVYYPEIDIYRRNADNAGHVYSDRTCKHTDVAKTYANVSLDSCRSACHLHKYFVHEANANECRCFDTCTDVTNRDGSKRYITRQYTFYRIQDPAHVSVREVVEETHNIYVCAAKTPCAPGRYAVNPDDHTRDNECRSCPFGKWTLGGVGRGAPRNPDIQKRGDVVAFEYAARGVDSCYTCGSMPHQWGVSKILDVFGKRITLANRDKLRACCPTSSHLGKCEHTLRGRLVRSPYLETTAYANYAKNFKQCWFCWPCPVGYGVSHALLESSEVSALEVCLPCQKNAESVKCASDPACNDDIRAKTGHLCSSYTDTCANAYQCRRCRANFYTKVSQSTTCRACTDKTSDPKSTQYERACDKFTPPGYIKQSVLDTVTVESTRNVSLSSFVAALDAWEHLVLLKKVSLYARQLLASFEGERVTPWLYSEVHDAVLSTQRIQLHIGCPAGYGLQNAANGNHVVQNWVQPPMTMYSNVTDRIVANTDTRQVQCSRHADCGNAAVNSISLFNDTYMDIRITDHICTGDGKSLTYCGSDRTCKLCRSPRYVTFPTLYRSNPAIKSCLRKVVIKASTASTTSTTLSGMQVYEPKHSVCEDLQDTSNRKVAEEDGAVVASDRRCKKKEATTFCDERTGRCTPCLASPDKVTTSYPPDLAAAYQPCNMFGKCGSDHSPTPESCAVKGTRLFCDKSQRQPPSFVSVSDEVKDNYPGTCMPCPQFVRRLALLPFLGHASCIPCASGWVSTESEPLCKPCPAGEYPVATTVDRQVWAYTTCKPCNKKGHGVVTFQWTGDGTHGNHSATTNGQVYSNQQCLPCHSVLKYQGVDLKTGKKACFNCHPGRMSTTNGDIERCDLCAPGYYGYNPDGREQAICEKCPAGRYGREAAYLLGMIDSLKGKLDKMRSKAEGIEEFCKKCPQGRSTNGKSGLHVLVRNGYQLPCEACGFGLVAPKTGSARCQLCSDYYNSVEYTAKTNEHIDCTECAGGKSAKPGGVVSAAYDYKSVVWRRATSSVGIANGVCSPCDRGRARAKGRNEIGCQLCPPGYYQDNINAEKCERCLPGKYSDVYGATLCTPCPVGRATKYTPRVTRKDTGTVTRSDTGTVAAVTNVNTFYGSTFCAQSCTDEAEWKLLASNQSSASHRQFKTNIRPSLKYGSAACCEHKAKPGDPWMPVACTSDISLIVPDPEHGSHPAAKESDIGSNHRVYVAFLVSCVIFFSSLLVPATRLCSNQGVNAKLYIRCENSKEMWISALLVIRMIVFGIVAFILSLLLRVLFSCFLLPIYTACQTKRATQNNGDGALKKFGIKKYGKGGGGGGGGGEDTRKDDITRRDPGCCHSCCDCLMTCLNVIGDVTYVSYLVKLGKYLHEIASKGTKDAVWTYHPFWEDEGVKTGQTDNENKAEVQETQSCCEDYCTKFTRILFLSFFLSRRKREGQQIDTVKNEEQAQIAVFNSDHGTLALKNRKFHVRI